MVPSLVETSSAVLSLQRDQTDGCGYVSKSKSNLFVSVACIARLHSAEN